VLTHSKDSDVCSRPVFLISFFHIYTKAICESTMRKQENQFMVQDGEIDHRQHAGNNSNALHMNA